MPDLRPIIITLQLDAKSAAFFQAQREQYFPKQINYTGAHLTLFHNLPGAKFDAVLEAIGRACTARPAFELTVAGVMKLGRGVAYKFKSDILMSLRADLARAFAPLLVGQDREEFRPHLTIQNKVAPHEAGALFDHLNAEFTVFSATAEGIQLWSYEGGRNRAGTWASAGAIAFQG